MSKGMELPINMIVVVLIAVLVLTTVGIFLSSQLNKGIGDIDYQKLYGDGCAALRFQYGCQASAVDSIQLTTSTGTIGFVSDVCPRIIKSVPAGLSMGQACARQCGC